MQSDLEQRLEQIDSIPTLDDRMRVDEMLGDLTLWVTTTSLLDSEKRTLALALEAAIEKAASLRTKASLLFILRKIDALLAAAVSNTLLEPVVRLQRELGALLYHVVDFVSTDMQLSPQERSTGLRDFEKNLGIAERVLAERGVFVPW